MTNTPRITILMATYKGQQYIRQQLDSLLAQTYTNWQLVIRDDGSSDDTRAIIKQYIALYPHISLIVNDSSVKGACANFSALFDVARKDENVQYLMFCDQDDIWKADKLEASLSALQQLERRNPGQPAMIYGDFELMDSNGNYVPGAFKLKHSLKLSTLLSFNYVYGCTIIMNRRLIDKIGSIPGYAINHDYWVALVASIYKSQFLDKKLLRYRQHDNNASGNVAGNSSLTQRLKRNMLNPEKEIDNMRVRLYMFQKFYEQHHNDLSPADLQMLTDFLQAFKTSRFKVSYVMLRDSIFRNGLFQTAASFFQVLFFYKRITAQNPVL